MQEFPDLAVSVRELDAETLKARLDAGTPVTILDTRRPSDFEAWHITHPGVTAVNVPFTEFLDGEDPVDGVPSAVPEGPLVTCCAKGKSSRFVAEFLAREGWDVEALADGMRGWARLYEYAEIEHEGSVMVGQYHRPSSGCLAYLVVDGDEAAVIDPLRAFTDRYVTDVRELGATLTMALDTHVHADHVSGVRELADRTGAEIGLPIGADDRGLAFDATRLADGDSISIGGTSIEAVHCPGHTTEMTAYRVADILLAGDTLFLDSIARPDLEDRDRAAEAAGQLFETLDELTALPDETIIAPGHTSPENTTRSDGTYTASLETLMDRHAVFSMDRTEFVDTILADLPPRPANVETIIPTNLGRESVSADEAFDLELGPNNCVATTAE